MSNNKLGETIAWIVVIVVVVMIAIFGMMNIRENYKKLDDVCKSAGYEKWTDMSSHYSGTNLFKMECDGEYIIEVKSSKTCSEYDKWGDCSETTNKYERASPFLG